jgi:hypothetical protein
MTMGCGDRRQTFGLDFARTFTIVSQASAINLQRQGRRSGDFIPDTGGEGRYRRDEPLLNTFSNRSWEPVLQNEQLVGLNARESDTHPRVGNDGYDTTERSERGISLRDSDPKLCACRRRIPRFNKAPADAEFIGPGGTPRI